jgi:ABC-type hemin transport system ATPase subunit
MKEGHIHAMGDASVLSAETIHAVYGVHVEVQTYREQPFVIPV